MRATRAIHRPGISVRAGLGLMLAFLLVALNPVMTIASDSGISRLSDKTDFSTRAQGDFDPEDFGLIDEFRYESPQFGYEVEWDDPWFVDLVEYPEGSLMSDPDTEPPFDQLRLQSEENDAAVSVYGYLLEGSWLEDADDVPAAHVDGYYAYENGEGLEETAIESIEVLFDDSDDEFGSALYLVTWENGERYMTINELRLVDDYFISTAISTDPMMFMETFEAARDAIEIDGDPALSFLDEDDIADAVEDAINDLDLQSGTDNDPEETPDTDGDSGDLSAYLVGVRGTVNALNDSVDRFFELLDSDEDLTQEDADELNDILVLWESAPQLAVVGGEPREGAEEIHALLQDYADTLADASDAFVAAAQSDDEDEQDELFEEFDDLINDADDLFDDLIDAIDEAEAED